MSGVLVMEDGTVVRGRPFGAKTTVFGELVFNTNMTGYCEALTDPSYKGQILMMTYPLIGNYGVDPSTFESSRIQVTAFIVREICNRPSHPSSLMDLDTFLKEQGVPGLSEVDTRMLTIKTRKYGTMKAALSTGEEDVEELLSIVRKMSYPDRNNLVSQVSCSHKIYHKGKGSQEIVLIDCGVKKSIIDQALNFGNVLQVPYDVTEEEIFEAKPNGIIISNGPGDPSHPEILNTTAKTVQKIQEDFPILGICLGHQILSLASGGRTFKLKFGHRGGNQPVKDLRTGHVSITSQNHGYAVDPDSLNEANFQVTHVNLNDGTVEGMSHKELPIISVQYHPEAHPGPRESEYVFQEFAEMVRKHG